MPSIVPGSIRSEIRRIDNRKDETAKAKLLDKIYYVQWQMDRHNCIYDYLQLTDKELAELQQYLACLQEELENVLFQRLFTEKEKSCNSYYPRHAGIYAQRRVKQAQREKAQTNSQST